MEPLRTFQRIKEEKKKETQEQTFNMSQLCLIIACLLSKTDQEVQELSSNIFTALFNCIHIWHKRNTLFLCLIHCFSQPNLTWKYISKLEGGDNFLPR